VEPDDKGGYVGRGGLKLEAAFRLLGGQEKARGVRALDIGASTGGFTECLLKFGATEVTAIDVGHDQLHERLRADPRVVSLERINFKTVSLKVAPGPFDFFVVDVSFVAARTMLRPLAFRLRPGAEGVVLIKPQFELPDGYVRHGDVKVESLRHWAVQRVRKKGQELGFRMLGEIDSPVVGGSGTVEILSRWRFEGMPKDLTRGSPPAVVKEPSLAPSAENVRAKMVPSPPTPPKPVPVEKPRGTGGGYADPSRPRRRPRRPR
jgi:23S rRNA (cytidine1920-2'-O)/16S rRNA (cytidine1409-2'-O)-methyltransferase